LSYKAIFALFLSLIAGAKIGAFFVFASNPRAFFMSFSIFYWISALIPLSNSAVHIGSNFS